MPRFYVTEDAVQGNQIQITGEDVNHIKNVLRMRPGEKITICNGQDKDYRCIIKDVCDKSILAEIVDTAKTGTELPVKLYLFQGLPKKDKMELILQKCVELGAACIVPVMTARSIVRLEDAKKEQKKRERWQLIAEGAAKQSGRGIIPTVERVHTFKEAIALAKTLDCAIIPYENAEGMLGTKKALAKLAKRGSAGIFIGPEGGFEESEIAAASEAGIRPVTLGKRILRTETAGLAVLSMIVYETELQEEQSSSEHNREQE
ncbi:MAG: 16S rRNA (uracil(1498)-N(3))-methyltransferase [Lachnospiraceae bacterium]|nr:16S rRNA (uracil(1498)-N(3))-methyltransferase [Lachnospiraceae bacterium]